MGDGKIYKCHDARIWVKSVVQDTGNNSDVFDAGKVMHCDDGKKWYTNYPMEKLYESYFNVVWTQAYNESGTKLVSSVHGDHPKAGDTFGFIGMWGFDNAAIKKFVADGDIKSIMIEVMYEDPPDNKEPTVLFAPHDRKLEPNTAQWEAIAESFATTKKFTKSTTGNYKSWITMTVASWLGGDIGGIACFGADDTAANFARFAGKTTSNGLTGFNTRLFIKVLK